MPSQHSKVLATIRRALSSRNVGGRTFRELYHFDSPDAEQTNSDRAAALIVGTILEEALEEAISTHFVGWKDISADDCKNQREQIFGHALSEISPLSTFASRIRMGFALGIYGPKMRDDLESIKNIRNLFAHFKGPVMFDHDEVKFLCDNLNSLNKLPRISLLFGRVPNTPKEKFIRVSQSICLYLVSGGVKQDAPMLYKNSTWEEFAS